MPLDTTEFDKRIAESRFSGVSGKDTYRGQSEAVMQLALEVVKAKFPDVIAKTDTKISSSAPKSSYNKGEYEWAAFSGTDEIRLERAGRQSPAWSERKQGSGSAIPSSQSINFTTTEVLDSVNTVLHELYHGQTKGGMFRQGTKEAAALLTAEDRQKINKLSVNTTNNFNASLYSMKEDYLDVEEFLANAFALTNMRDRGLIAPGTRSADQLTTLEEIIKEIPNAKKFIEAQMDPRIPSLKEVPAGMVDSIIGSIKGMLK